METPVWVNDILHLVKQEYAKSAPNYTLVDLTINDEDYIHSLIQDKDPFDTLELKKKMVQARKEGKAHAIKSVSVLGEIILLAYKSPSWTPNYTVWWRAIRLLNKQSAQPVRIIIFAHPTLRQMPEHGHSVKAEHINGGYAHRCNGQSIVIYRKEEITRVLLHELFHSSCSDPYHKSIPNIEADTEAWAEIVLCAMIAKGLKPIWKKVMNEQIEYSLRQAATLRDNHAVNSISDYAWRYAIGRLEVWRRLGLRVPEVPTKYIALESLRLTYLEPTN